MTLISFPTMKADTKTTETTVVNLAYLESACSTDDVFESQLLFDSLGFTHVVQLKMTSGEKIEIPCAGRVAAAAVLDLIRNSHDVPFEATGLNAQGFPTGNVTGRILSVPQLSVLAGGKLGFKPALVAHDRISAVDIEHIDNSTYPTVMIWTIDRSLVPVICRSAAHAAHVVNLVRNGADIDSEATGWESEAPLNYSLN